MLPDDDHLPAKFFELFAVPFVPLLSLLKLRFPKLPIGFRNPLIAYRTAMPKASVDEYGDLSSSRAYSRDIRSS